MGVTAHVLFYFIDWRKTMATPVSIVAKSYSNTCYFVGDTSNVRVKSIKVTYDDETVETITDGYTVSQINTSEAGEKKAKVEYLGLTAEISIIVLDSYNVQAGTPNLEDVTITFDLSTGVMNITGTGEFIPYYQIQNTPDTLGQKIKTLNIGNGITKIPNGAFYSNNNLKSISFSNTLTEIGDGNFADNSIITTLDFPESLKTIGSSSFSGLSNLQEITFHEGLKTIKGQAFNDCPLVKNLVLPTTLTSMTFSFRNSSLESLVMGGENVGFTQGGSGIGGMSAKNMTIRGGTINASAFSGYTNIENVILDGSVKWNRGGQFQRCVKLASVSIGDGITSIPNGCFGNCSSLNNVILPDSVETLEQTAFSGCSSLSSITLSKNIKKIPTSCFSNCGFETFTISDDLKIEELENVVFQGCSNLKMVYIGKNVKTIGPGCFASIGSPSTVIQINQKKDAISGSPWAASNATVEWIAKEVVEIELTSLPSKLKYKRGESFNSSGLIVTATYDDGTVQETTSYTLFLPDMSTAGTKTITVTCGTQTATFDITVIAITKIEITTPPTKQEYRKGDTLDATGMVVSTVWTDGSKEVLTDGYTVSDLDSTETGEKTITVTYQTFTATFTVEVVADTAGIRISHYPNKVYYKIGESLDTTGLTVAKYRADGTEVEITGYTVSELDSSISGSKTVNVFYTEAISSTESETFNTDFQVRVTKDGNNPFDGSSSGGSGDVEEEKTEPIKVTVHWINGEFSDLTNENIDQNTLTLHESICSEQYFIFGGCVCNQITFQAHHEQFNGTSEEFYPSGKIEVYIERKGTKIKIFTGEIDSAERKANSLTRNFIAYDYLYKLRNTDIARWYKNQTTDKKKKLTQKQFRDKLFEFLGLEQVDTKLHWDDTYVPDMNNSNEMNVVNILKDLCLQNDRFGWMNRDGKFEYLKLRQNSYRYGQTTGNQNIYKYYNNEEVHLDTFKSFTAKEGRIWFPNIIFCDPDPNRAFGFTQGDYTVQEAYDNNVYYNRNSFFVGNEDWLNYVWNADEYGGISRVEPIMKNFYGGFVKQELRENYCAPGYTARGKGNHP
mgnify:CR=1 FL=1